MTPVQRILHDWGVGERYLDASWDSFDMSRVPAALHADLKDFRSWTGKSRWLVLLCGRYCPGSHPGSHDVRNVGAGKTHLAVATLRRWAEHRVDIERRNTAAQPDEDGLVRLLRLPGHCRFAVISDLLERLQPGPDQEAARAEYRAMKKMPLVVLDDLGAGRERATDHVLQTLYVLINARYNDCLPTVVTTNLSPSGIASVFSEQLASRFAQESLRIYMDLRDARLGG